MSILLSAAASQRSLRFVVFRTCFQSLKSLRAQRTAAECGLLEVAGLLDLSVGEGFQFFHDLFQPAAALGVILLGGQGSSLLGILLVESLDVTDLCL